MSDDVLEFDDKDDEEENQGAFRDGKFWVLSEKCETCIFRPGNLMHLRDGARDALVEEACEANSFIPCHDTLAIERGRSVCRGFFDVHRGDTFALRMAAALDILAFDDPPKED